jgi:hypothetical protein
VQVVFWGKGVHIGRRIDGRVGAGWRIEKLVFDDWEGMVESQR